MSARNDRLVGLIATGAGAAVEIAVRQLPSIPVYGDVGPAFFPRLVGVGLIVIGMLLLIVPRRTSGSSQGSANVPLAGGQYRDIGLLLIVTLGYVAVMESIGFIGATILYVAALSVLFGSRRWVPVVLMSVGVTAFLYVAFKLWLRVPLPS